jgi:predicted phosphodiesterase
MSKITLSEDLEMKIEKSMKIAIVLPDIHVPYHDEKAINLVLKYVKDVKPDKIIQLGDFYDTFGISKYDKDPNRVDTLQQEIDTGYKLWKDIKRASPKSELVMLEGNHEARLRAFLMKNPGVYSLDALKPKNLFKLDELKVKWIPQEETYKINNSLVVIHGHNAGGGKLSQHSAYSAKNTLEKWGNVSGIMGHGHRLGMSCKTLHDGSVVQWYEAGHLANPHPDYMKNPNWQQGFIIVRYTNNRFHIAAVPITNYKMMVDGKMYQ